MPHNVLFHVFDIVIMDEAEKVEFHLPVNQANDVQVFRVGRPSNDDTVRPEVGMADAERNESRVPGDERQRDGEIRVQVVYVVRRRLERQQWSTELFK